MPGKTDDLWLGVLGPLLVRRAGQVLDVGPPKRRALALRLLLEDGRAVSTDRLCEDLWPGKSPTRAVPSLHSHISRLRAVLEPERPAHGKAGVLIRETRGYALRVPSDALDSVRFEQAVARAGRLLADGASRRACREIESALSLWRGAPLEDAQDYLFAARQTARLNTARVAAEELHICALVQDEDLHRAVGEAEALIVRHPLREITWALLMCALYLTGRHADALSRFEELRKSLAEELGLRPSPGLSALQEAILRHDLAFVRRMARSVLVPGYDQDTSPGSVDAADPAVRIRRPPPDPPTGNTSTTSTRDTAHTINAIGGLLRASPLVSQPTLRPAQLPPESPLFTGRRRELESLHAALRDTQQKWTAPPVILVGGVPGVGKTTLALRFAHQVAGRFPDGQLFADLRGFNAGGTARDTAEVLQEFLTSLGTPPSAIPASVSHRTALLRTILARRRVLLFLDNARDEEQVRPLLPGTPSCMAVVTSRNELHGLLATEGARSFTLPVPPVEEGRAILTRRLGATRVEADPEATEEIVRLCAGLPLALAIAAARATLHPEFPLRALAEEMRASEGSLDAFSGTGDSSDVRAVFSWTYRALSPQAARLFRLLALHPGPDISTAAAASLAGLPVSQTRAALTELTRTRMLAEDSVGRFALHDLLRVYAGELVREQETPSAQTAALLRTYDHYLDAAHTGAPSLCHIPVSPGPPSTAGTVPERQAGTRETLRWFEAEEHVLHALLRQAARDGFHHHACRLAWWLQGYLDAGGRSAEAVAVLSVALDAARAAGDAREQARLHRALAGCLGRTGRYREGLAHLDRAADLLEHVDDYLEHAWLHLSFGALLHATGRDDAALHRGVEALHMAREHGDLVTEADACNSVGWTLSVLGRPREALAYCRRSVAGFRRAGVTQREAYAWDSLGHALHRLGRHRWAVGCYRTALRLLRACGDTYTPVGTLVRLGDAGRAAGDATCARLAWERALALAEKQPDAHPLDEIRDRVRSLAATGRTGD
ncbi:BTAD domain-containing putative transcriptional regulator [Streptomyces sp. YS415]|uniref:AfsR/SARP family transcriptional regulator n=1 Tax=Streptomyces sp. YS415 TaxID=2944806 RepID=UPI00201FC59C|nr:BTAD domain-containing putative transcriptional regulator [Streptomyces sp. YS415]MCL7429385.1 AAA family ATPase [Streptomyces sp. YS415]